MNIINKRINILVSLSALAIWGCSTDPILVDPDSLGEYYLNCKISPGISQQTVWIGKTVPEFMPQDIEGAKVIIQSDDQSVVLAPGKAGEYIDVSSNLIVAPGKRYQISALLPDGAFLTAHTVVPVQCKLLSSTDTLQYIVDIPNTPYTLPDRLARIAPLIRWTRSEHGFSYRITFGSSLSSTVDTSLTLPWAKELIPQSEIIPSSMVSYRAVSLAITVFDSTYLPPISSYMSAAARQRIIDLSQQLNLVQGDNDNINGGFGYFGAWVTTLDTVVVKITRKKFADEAN